jgi:squalene-hopene/tetraprenyl-beta-curcumene cyclase
MRTGSVLNRIGALTLIAAICVRGAEVKGTDLVSATQPAGTIGVSLRNEVNAAIDRSLDWLAAQQKDNGSWSNEQFPALTALPLRAFVRSGHPRAKQITSKGVDFILSCVRDDGGIYIDVVGRKGGGLSNYNTAICMATLHETGRPELVAVVQKAREFVAQSQHLGDDIYRGGFGYDAHTGRAYTDLLNTYHAVQAMRLTQGVEDLRPAGEARVDINWDEATAYIAKMQNEPEDGPSQEGGFFYKPGESKAGTTTNLAGEIVFRSYGSITYVGLLSLIFARVEPDDPRILSALDWSARHWSLEENPGMGAEGLYFFYNVLTKSLSAAGRDLIARPDKTQINWREDLADRLISLQKVDPKTGHGYWANETGRFWESDPVLVTAYAVLALQML